MDKKFKTYKYFLTTSIAHIFNMLILNVLTLNMYNNIKCNKYEVPIHKYKPIFK